MSIAIEDLELELPEVREPAVIDYDGEYFAKLPDKRVTGDSIVEVYDKVRKKTSNIEFSTQLPELDETLGGKTIMVDGRTLVALPDRSHLEYLEYELENFLRVSRNFENNEDFYNSYHYLKFHPLFWAKIPSEDPTSPSWHWITDGGMGRVVTFVYKNAGKTGVALEAEPTYRGGGELNFISSNYDYELDSYGDTYEEAVISLAKKVKAKYGNNGVEK